jgi:hypothetical protein
MAIAGGPRGTLTNESSAVSLANALGNKSLTVGRAQDAAN